MVISRFLKKGLSIFLLCFLANLGSAQTLGTKVYYIRSIGYAQRIMSAIDSADFTRVLPPFGIEDRVVEVKEYYLDGKVKSVTQCKAESISLIAGIGKYNGKRITFYPSGIRESICEYTDGIKNGIEYQYYLDGKLHLVIKNQINYIYHNYDIKVIDFFDKAGTQICAEGNGHAIIYDTDSKIILKGPIKDGKMNGAWEGFSRDVDDVKYQLIFKDNDYQSGKSYELTTGKSYTFKALYVAAHNEKDIVVFVSKLKKNLKLPKNTAISGKEIDSVKIYFEIETDGKITHFSTIEPVSDELMNALKLAIDQCPKWEPAKIYGIPLRTQIAVSLGIQQNSKFSFIRRTVENYQVPLYKGMPIGALPTIPKEVN
jgi:antitoxin component YwqK of YwqJK toxin-antitoxin module